MKVICNASPLISFGSIGKVQLLSELFDEIVIPQKVQAEILEGNRLGLIAIDLDNFPIITIQKLKNQDPINFLQLKLGPGESEAIALALESGIQCVILDDKSARKIARNLGLQVIGTIGILVKLKELGLIENVSDLLTELEQRINFRISNDLKKRILQQCNEA